MRTFSFYKFCDLSRFEPVLHGGLRSVLLSRLGDAGVLGRVYLCRSEGINGLCSASSSSVLQEALASSAPEFSQMQLNEAVEQGSAFSARRLHVRWRGSLVNCGPSNEPGLARIVQERTRLQPRQWNEELQNPHTVLIDARNAYEAEVGRMDGVRAKTIGQGALKFRDQVQQIVQELDGQTDKRVLMFCTSGIRCEKLAAILEGKGFNNIAQLDGGVTKYVRTAREQGIPVKFKLSSRMSVFC